MLHSAFELNFRNYVGLDTSHKLRPSLHSWNCKNCTSTQTTCLSVQAGWWCIVICLPSLLVWREIVPHWPECHLPHLTPALCINRMSLRGMRLLCQAAGWQMDYHPVHVPKFDPKYWLWSSSRLVQCRHWHWPRARSQRHSADRAILDLQPGSSSTTS